MNYTYKFDGGQLDCELEYEPNEIGLRDPESGYQIDPDIPARVILISAKLGDVELYQWLSACTIMDIEEKAICND